MFYYYPLSSKDYTFENIFSSESVSPPFFYKNRGFGIEYFNVIPSINHPYAIILYSNPPVYEVGDNIKFILQLEDSCLDMNNLVFLSEGIFAYQKTIYLNKNNFKIDFLSEKDKRIIILKAATSLPTKNLDKYLNNFQVISEDICVEYDFSNIKYNIDDLDYTNLIKEDKKYNQFKGLVYGIATGLFNNKSKEEIFLRRLIREIVNSFAELKSRLSNSKVIYSKNYNLKKDSSEIGIYIERLLEVIELTEKSHNEFFVNLDIDINSLAKILHEQIGHITSIEQAKQFITYVQIEDEAFETTKLNELKKKYSRYNNSLHQDIPLKTLKEQINRFIEGAAYNKETDLTELNDDIKITFHKIDRAVSKIWKNVHTSENFTIDNLEYDFNKNTITITDKFQDLTITELTDMIVIVNIILKFSEKNKTILQKDAILKIVKEVGNYFSKGSKETLLYQYLNNEIDTYAFEKITNSVMRNFVAFIFNIESLEKLENFIDKKNVEKDWMAYSFWGSFNGFANLSGNFTRMIFSDKGEAIQMYLDTYLNNYVDILKKIEPTAISINSIEEKEPNPSPQLSIDTVKNFYINFVSGKFNITYEEFYSIVLIKDKEVFCKDLKLKFKINKKEAEKLFNSIKRDFDSPLLFN